MCLSDCSSWNGAREGTCKTSPSQGEGRITQLTQTFQQGTRATGQVVDTRVLDGSEKAWPNWSLVAKAYVRAIDQQLSDDMGRERRSVRRFWTTTARRRNHKPEVCSYTSSWSCCALGEHWIVSPTQQTVNGSVASALPSVLPEQREAGRDDAGRTVVSVRHE